MLENKTISIPYHLTQKIERKLEANPYLRLEDIVIEALELLFQDRIVNEIVRECAYIFDDAPGFGPRGIIKTKIGLN